MLAVRQLVKQYLSCREAFLTSIGLLPLKSGAEEGGLGLLGGDKQLAGFGELDWAALGALAISC